MVRMVAILGCLTSVGDAFLLHKNEDQREFGSLEPTRRPSGRLGILLGVQPYMTDTN